MQPRRILTAALAVLVLLCTPAAADEARLLSEDVVRRLLAGLTLEAPADREALVSDLFTPRLIDKHGNQKLAGMIQRLRDDLGAPDAPPVIRDERRTPGKWTLVLAAAGEALRIVLDFDPVTGRIDGLLVDGDVSGAAAPAPGQVEPGELAGAIRSHLAALVADDAFSGAVLVAHKGKPVFAEAYGFANREKKIRNTLDTPMNVGSMTKMLTGLAVMQLVRQGKIDLDATLGTYLPDLPNATLRDRATMRQLLTHQAGVGSYWNEAFRRSQDSIDSLASLAETFIHEPLLFPPGEGYEYSNGGPVLLGLVIEAVTGESYFDYLRSHIYRPAGMKRSGHFKKTDARAGFARGYDRLQPDAERFDTHATRPLMGSPAGSSFHSARDLLRFINALEADKLIDAEGRRMLWEPRVRESDDFQYGFLWGNQHTLGRRSVGHNGGAPGVSADLRHFPEPGYTVIVLSNYGRAADAVAEWIAGVVAGLPGER